MYKRIVQTLIINKLEVEEGKSVAYTKIKFFPQKDEKFLSFTVSAQFIGDTECKFYSGYIFAATAAVQIWEEA